MPIGGTIGDRMREKGEDAIKNEKKVIIQRLELLGLDKTKIPEATSIKHLSEVLNQLLINESIKKWR